MPTVAECAGLLYLCRSVDGLPMVGAIEADAIMTERLTLSYRTAITDRDQLLAIAGTQVNGHEFHRTAVDPSDGALPHGSWMVSGWDSLPTLPDIGRDTVHASYLHLHWAGYPKLAQRFADAVHDHAQTRAPYQFMISTTMEIRTLPKGYRSGGQCPSLGSPRLAQRNHQQTRLRTWPPIPTLIAASKAMARAHGVGIDQVLPLPAPPRRSR
jgi:cobyrinic acid a,c-diamide synthase